MIIYMEDIFGKLGLKLAHILTGLLGGAVALIFGKTRPSLKEKIRAVFIVLAGSIVTGYVTPMVLLWKPTLIGVEHGIAFLIGIFGMGVVEGLLTWLSKFRKSPVQAIKDIKNLKDE